MRPRDALFLAGPTGVGKSQVALRLAERIGGEIITVDSMQVYQGLDLGTAKPSLAEQARIRHHLVDILDLKQSFDAAQFVERARAAENSILVRGKVPIFCGGTGLYFKAYLAGIGQGPPASKVIRAELEQTPLPQLLEELAVQDPETFGRIDRRNRRRIVRALEVIRITGKPFSVQRAPWRLGPSADTKSPIVLIALERTREDLNRQIYERVEQMFALGLVTETEQLLAKGLAENPNASSALGYRQVIDYLQGGLSLNETKELVKIKTRQFAKRQMTWLRHQLPVEWIRIEPDASLESVAVMIERYLAPEAADKPTHWC